MARTQAHGTTTVLIDASETRRALFSLFDWADDISFAYAWMTCGGGDARHWNELPTDQIVKGVVGLHFAGTDPEVLEHFFEEIPGRVRVMYETQGTFHPKVVVGRVGDHVRAIVGSSNFTRAAFSSNFEVNVLLEGDADWAPLAALIAVVDGYFASPKSRDLSKDLLEAYRETWATERPTPPPLPSLDRGAEEFVVEEVRDLEVAWSDYFQLIKDQDQRELLGGPGYVRVIPTASDDDAYMTEVRRARSAFSEFGSLAKMPPVVRRGVCGFGESLGWFGSMRGAGYFKGLVNAGAEGLSDVLDEIPATGDVQWASAESATELALELHGVGLGCWSRLLCVKRPDVFLSVNNANRARVREVFGSAPSSAHAYFGLIRRIHALPWAAASEPDDPFEREVWAARVALLDAILYEPSGE